MVRHTMQRLEAGELTLQEAIVLLRSLGETGVYTAFSPARSP